ncbi:ATP-binding protein [Sorangium sp. So ce1153]|uniref:ATP-binding protein n=1 Tax=Sorangium sp. So ce1153 TaxID=3133333 RepID=UPI003F64182C
MQSKAKLVREVGNWVSGERFWNREKEIWDLKELLGEGANVLIAAPRRVGKTSVMRKLCEELEQGNYRCLFLDLQRSQSGEDAIVELGVATRPHQTLWDRAKELVRDKAERLESLGTEDFKLTFREHLKQDWQAKGERLFDALAGGDEDKPVVIFMDELPILVNRLLKGDEYTITPERRKLTDEFLSFLRAQTIKHRSKIRLVVAGSIGLEPVLRQAGLSATINTFTPFELRPWDEETAVGCLDALANNYSVVLLEGAARRMVEKLGSCIPHHVQMFFNHVYNDTKRRAQQEVSLEDVERVYKHSMLSTRGHAELSHMEERLKLVLGQRDLPLTLDLLTEAAVVGVLTPGASMALARDSAAIAEPGGLGEKPQDVLRRVVDVLKHDGYLVDNDAGALVFGSLLLRDWWKGRFASEYTPAAARGAP